MIDGRDVIWKRHRECGILGFLGTLGCCNGSWVPWCGQLLLPYGPHVGAEMSMGDCKGLLRR